MSLVISIPTYWGRREGWQPGDIAFDHPTPLGSPGTLGRTLESLSVLRDEEYSLVVVVAATSPELASHAEESVASIIARNDCPKTPLLIAERNVAALQDLLREDGRSDLAGILSLGGYSGVRNIQLLSARFLRSDAAVLIDDDELIEDPEFLTKVHGNIARGLCGFAGYYLSGAGDYLIAESDQEWERCWGKRSAMNRALSRFVGKPPKLKKTPFAFGGNMVISDRTLRSVPFDPMVPRGEDIDYLINARLSGRDFVMDNTLAIRHLPPPDPRPEWQGLRQDMERFIYEREKVRQAGLDARELDPYPGELLGDDLKTRASRTLELLVSEYQRRGDGAAAEHAISTLKY
ncbi:hypothetical protein ACFL2T_01360, partial [Elusimicrobiota bacterium]